ncbi:tyrosine kinase receptor Cad96Ca-like isoform X1 [Apostichopus japonicus]|uniref:tyrosine kinase receptor Cad96Ca-like isoform X1 n=1 Tax=Stichopus japonicus TaxID=307972 RepID=UPI003AB35EA3
MLITMEKYLAIIVFLVNLKSSHGVTITPSDLIVLKSSSLKMACPLDDHHRTSLKWEFNGRPLFVNMVNIGQTAKHQINAESYSLTIENATSSEEGLYSCSQNGSVIVSYNVDVAVDSNVISGTTLSAVMTEATKTFDSISAVMVNTTITDSPLQHNHSLSAFVWSGVILIIICCCIAAIAFAKKGASGSFLERCHYFISTRRHFLTTRHETPMTPVQPVQENQTPAQPVEYQEVSDQHIGTGCKHPQTSEEAKSSAYFISLLQEGEIQIYWLCYDNVRGINTVARTLSEKSNIKDIVSFRLLAKELRCIKYHDNVVKMLQADVDVVPPYMYFEFVDCGNVRDYLLRTCRYSKSKANENRKLINISLETAEAMDFLNANNFAHPALSARKILLKSNGQCKLYDFWSFDLSHQKVAKLLEKVDPPVPWLAPETIFLGEYHISSDVWSYGTVLWELFARGEYPYAQLSPNEIEIEVRKGVCLRQPPLCPGKIFRYSVMLRSWTTMVKKRPTFGNIIEALTLLLRDEKDEVWTPSPSSVEYYSLEESYVAS